MSRDYEGVSFEANSLRISSFFLILFMSSLMLRLLGFDFWFRFILVFMVLDVMILAFR